MLSVTTMNEYPVSITCLNDFIFCPISIYFHSLDSETDRMEYQDEFQLNGTSAHEKSDTGAYSTKKNMLQGMSVYSEKYNLFGKIDTFDTDKGVLTERKKKIKTIYDGYIFQLYAQYFALTEMGYAVSSIRLYSMDDNKVYNVTMPDDNPEMLLKFEKNISDIQNFSMENFKQTNIQKCNFCIYEPLCSYSLLKKEDDDNDNST